MFRVRKFVGLLLMSFCLATVFVPIQVHATETTDTEEKPEDAVDEGGSLGSDTTLDTGDAISDILLGERYQGAISSISWVTTRIDSVTVMLISAAAFFIISAAFLKNVCAGVYCSNTKFFDKVDEAHKKAEALSLATVKGYFSGGQFQNTSVGGFRDALLVIVPNFKSWTEFDEADIEPKQYFMRSIPQMLFAVIIGIFIYNGYYRDTAVKVGQFGSEAFQRVMATASPVELLDKLSATTGTPDFITDGSITPAGKLANDIAHKAYSAIITKYSDMTSTSQKLKLVAGMEKDIIDFVNTECIEYLQFAENDTWKSSYKVSLTPNAIDVPPEKTEDYAQIRYMSSEPVVNLWGLQTVKGTEMPYYLSVIVTFTPDAYKGDKAGAGENISGSSNAGDIAGTLTEWSSEFAEIQLPMQSSSDGSYTCAYPTEMNGFTFPMKIQSGKDLPVGKGLTMTITSEGPVLTYRGDKSSAVTASKSFYAVKDRVKYVIRFTIVDGLN